MGKPDNTTKNPLNVKAQPLPEAEARHERTLEAVGCSILFGAVPLIAKLISVLGYRRPLY
jgi:hypothetical protein